MFFYSGESPLLPQKSFFTGKKYFVMYSYQKTNSADPRDAIHEQFSTYSTCNT